MYSVFLQNDILFRISKYYKLQNGAATVMKKFTRNIILGEAIRRKEASSQSSKLHLIDVLFANNLDKHNLQDQIDTFIVGVCIVRMIKGWEYKRRLIRFGS